MPLPVLLVVGRGASPEEVLRQMVALDQELFDWHEPGVLVRRPADPEKAQRP